MAIVEIKIPSPGESITHVELTRWLVKDGVVVKKDSEIAELESEKATLMLVAQETGKISLNVTEGASIKVGDVACTIDTSVQYEASLPSETKPLEKPTGEALLNGTDATPGLSGMTGAISTTELTSTTETTRITASGPISPPKTTLNTLDVDNKKTTLSSEQISDNEKVKITPLAKKVMMDNNLSLDDVIKGLKRLRREDVEAVLQASEEVVVSGLKKPANRESSRERLSSLRRKLSERLVSVKNETAMLTTFNEVDMKPIMDLRKKYQSRFVEKHGIKLGIMSFFLKACSVALLEYPKVNGMLDGEDMVTFDYTDISVAVSAPKGLMVPVIRNVESLGLAEIERVLEELAAKARSGRLSIAEMSGGTFTVTNGGVFGSMMSTPLINPPQSAILGMHNIIERPVAIDGQVVIRPMMYVALSYDHRVIDGKESVGFLVRVKQLLENPTDLLFGGSSADKILLEL